MTTYQEFLARTRLLENGCRIPLNTKTGMPLTTVNGYSRITGRITGSRLAHRVAWVLANGPLDSNIDLDHLCRNRACCEITHLEPVTRRENLLRGETIPAAHKRKTHCPQGHEYTPENTIARSRGSRECKTCKREYYHANKHKRLRKD